MKVAPLLDPESCVLDQRANTFFFFPVMLVRQRSGNQPCVSDNDNDYLCMSGAMSVVNTDTCNDQQETAWSAGESRTMQRLMLGSTDITLSLTW